MKFYKYRIVKTTESDSQYKTLEIGEDGKFKTVQIKYWYHVEKRTWWFFWKRISAFFVQESKAKDLIHKLYSIKTILIFLIITTFSCIPVHDYPPVNEHHVSIFDENTYFFSDSKNLSNPSIPSQNGDTYTYELEGNNVKITTDLEPKWVRYYTSTRDSEGIIIERENGYWSKENLTQYHYFKFKY